MAEVARGDERRWLCDRVARAESAHGQRLHLPSAPHVQAVVREAAEPRDADAERHVAQQRAPSRARREAAVEGRRPERDRRQQEREVLGRRLLEMVEVVAHLDRALQRRVARVRLRRVGVRLVTQRRHRVDAVVLQRVRGGRADVHRLEEVGDVRVDGVLQIAPPTGVLIDECGQVVAHAANDPVAAHRSRQVCARAACGHVLKVYHLVVVGGRYVRHSSFRYCYISWRLHDRPTQL